MKKKELSHADINLASIAFAIGQQDPKGSIFNDMALLIKYVESFNDWEKKNVLCLPNGWEDYTKNGGNDYESAIYEWTKDFWL